LAWLWVEDPTGKIVPRRWFEQETLLEWLDGYGVVSVHGDEHVVACPECGAEKLWVNVERGTCICYKCEFGGSLYHLLESAEGMPKAEARKLLGIDGEERQERSDDAGTVFAEVPRETLVSVPEFQQVLPAGVQWYASGVASCRADAELAGQLLQAIYNRGFTWDEVVRYSVGWCWRGRWGGRVILPVFKQGKVVFWQAWLPGGGDFKYLNPKNEEVPFSRKQLVYGIEDHPGAGTLVVVEGMFNRWAVEQVGYSAVCTFGKMVSEEQVTQLLAHKAQTVLVGLDDDARDKALFLSRELRAYGKDARLCTLPAGADWNDLPPGGRLEVLQAAGVADWLWG
jgi:hypothetical protein